MEHEKNEKTEDVIVLDDGVESDTILDTDGVCCWVQLIPIRG